MVSEARRAWRARSPRALRAARRRASGVGRGAARRTARSRRSTRPRARTPTSRCARRCAPRARTSRVFDAAFAAVFGAPARAACAPTRSSAARRELGAAALPRDRGAADAGAEPASRRSSPARPPWSEVELLREKDFADYTDAERARRAPAARAARAARPDAPLAAHARRRAGAATRPTCARRCAPRCATAASRSSAAGASPPQRPRRLVLVCDVSGSMAPYARMLLQYLHAAVAARARVEAFAFGTRLTRITRELAGRDPDRALRARRRGGRRLVGRHAHRRRARRAQPRARPAHRPRRGRRDPVRRLGPRRARSCWPRRWRACAARAHRVVWLNPLAADPRYEPLTRGMRAALPHADHFLAGNSLASLEQLAELMEAADRDDASDRRPRARRGRGAPLRRRPSSSPSSTGARCWSTRSTRCSRCRRARPRRGRARRPTPTAIARGGRPRAAPSRRVRGLGRGQAASLRCGRARRCGDVRLRSS